MDFRLPKRRESAEPADDFGASASRRRRGATGAKTFVERRDFSSAIQASSGFEEPLEIANSDRGAERRMGSAATLTVSLSSGG
jgi:hypothetical protein